MRSVTHVVALGFCMLSARPVYAQGTAAQREACTPDAVRLCADTIPDVARTTACMKAHSAELSPGCRAVVAGAMPPTPAVAAPAAPVVSGAERAAVREVRPYHPPPSRTYADPDAEISYVPPRRVIEPPVYTQPGRVIFPAQPYPDGTFCSPPYDFCEPVYVDPNAPE